MEQLQAGDEAEGVSPVLVAEPWPELIDAREALIPELVAEMRDLLAKNGLFQGFSELVAKTLEESAPIALQVEPDADKGPIDPEVLRTASVAALRALYTEILEAGTDESFRTHFTHDALAHATAWALGDLIRSTPREQLLGMDAATFREAYDRAYRSKDYLSQALETLLPSYVEMAGQAVLDVIAANTDAPNLKDRLEAAFRQALSNDTVSGNASHPLKGARVSPLADMVRPDGTIKVPTMHPVRALFDAIHAAPSGLNWSDYDGLRTPTHTTRTGQDKAGAVYVSLQLKTQQPQPTEAELATLWDKLRRMDQMTSDMLIYCLAACLGQPGWVWIVFTDFLKARNIKPIQKPGEPRTWGHGYRTEQIAEAAIAIDQLELLYIEMENVLLPNKKQSLTRNSPALTTRERWVQREMNGVGVACAVEMQLGTWAEAYRELDAIQFGYLAKKVIEYNPRTRQPEKLIAKYLLFHQRNNAKNATFRRSILTLLTVADIKRDTVRPQQTEKRLLQALDRLCEDGVIGRWRHIIDADARRARGRSRDWGKAMIEIDPPAATRAQYSRFQRPSSREVSPPGRRAAKG